jgi:manganese/iron transport system substrate-binding protein
MKKIFAALGKRFLLLSIVSFLTVLVACSGDDRQNTEGKPIVVSTSTIIANLTDIIGGEAIDDRGILQAGTDPHVYEPRPQDSAILEQADLILYNGYNLEPGLIKLMNSAGVKAKKFAVGEIVKPLDLEKNGETVPDPHVWGSAENGILMVNGIKEQLIAISPANKATFEEKAAKLSADLAETHAWIQKQIQTIPPDKRQLVTTHDAFQYYARAYGLKVIGTLIGISTEEQPSAQTVKNLAESVRKSRVPAIFAETTLNPNLIKTVAEEAGVKIAPKALYSDSIGAVGSEADSYIKMLVTNTKTIVEALTGE